MNAGPGLDPFDADRDAHSGTTAAVRSGAEPAPMRGIFARRVASVLATRVTLFFLSFATSILLSWALGPDGKGTYVAIVTLPGMLAALGLFGLPTAVNYFAGRGSSVASLIRASYLFSIAISVAVVGIAWLILPTLESSILSAASNHDGLLRVILLTVPLGTVTAFGGAILYGRLAVRVYNLIQIALAALSLACLLIVVGVLGFGVTGAVAVTVLANVLTVLAVMAAAHRLSRSEPGGSPAPLPGVLSYGARSYPASVAGFFNYRADTYVLQAMAASQATRLLGLYSMAVTMAELVFYVPDSVATIFLPRVAGSTPEDANRMLGRVGRLTTLLTLCVAACLVPVAWLGIHLVLPRFVDCLPAFVVLLPGVVALSVAKVMTSYLSGRGRPGLVTLGTVVALILNVVLNIILIPAYGIVGASLSSLVSYSLQAVIALVFASRLSGQPLLSLFVPGLQEAGLVVATLPRLLASVPFVRRFVATHREPG